MLSPAGCRRWRSTRARARGPSTSSASSPTYLRYVDDSSRKLARSILEGVGRWEAALQQKQSFLARIVDIGTELFAIAAAVCYADTIGSDHPERKTEAVELAELFCGQAKGRAETLFNALWSNRDDANYAAAQEVLAGRYTWLEDGIADPSGDGPMMPPLDDAGSRTRHGRLLARRDRSCSHAIEELTEHDVVGSMSDAPRGAARSVWRSARAMSRHPEYATREAD